MGYYYYPRLRRLAYLAACYLGAAQQVCGDAYGEDAAGGWLPLQSGPFTPADSQRHAFLRIVVEVGAAETTWL